MSKDFRIIVGWHDHPKTQKLIRKGGFEAAFCLTKLWGWVSVNRPKGILTDMDEDDIEIAAGWSGNDGEFVALLIKMNWLEVENDVFSLHDWEECQPWAYYSEERSEKARNAAKAKWAKEKTNNSSVDGGASSNATSNAGSIGLALPLEQCPSPTPTPTPNPSPVHQENKPRNKYTDEFETFWKLYPKKENKGAAFKAFKKAIKTTDAETIITSVQRQLDDPMSCLRKDRQFIPHGSSWLNGERWHDETNKLTDEFFMGVATAWNNHFSEFQYVKTMTDDRKNAIQKIVDNFPKRDMTEVEQWERFFIYIIDEQGWFLGNNQLGIKGSFDKLLDGDMFFKIAENVKVWR